MYSTIIVFTLRISKTITRELKDHARIYARVVAE